MPVEKDQDGGGGEGRGAALEGVSGCGVGVGTTWGAHCMGHWSMGGVQYGGMGHGCVR